MKCAIEDCKAEGSRKVDTIIGGVGTTINMDGTTRIKDFRTEAVMHICEKHYRSLVGPSHVSVGSNAD